MKTDLTQKFCIVGTGGFAREVLCCLLDIFKSQGIPAKGRIVFLDHEGICDQQELMGFQVIKGLDFNPLDFRTVVAVGDPVSRKRVVNELPVNTVYQSIIHPTAVISDFVEIGVGAIIGAFSYLTCNIKIGEHSQLNSYTGIGHDSVIGDFFTTATGVIINGSCTLGECVYFGTKASIKQGLSVCDNVIVGMSAMVLKNISESGTYIGVPAKLLTA